ncbi:hypothetical protein [Aliivibrio fischeri]|uniref:hypothetical protein n=1 Tax=Aliivibrio fischeri TaxID=668 RepID=UPI00159ED49B|nr:hypothetical protein [Aliivibrio fischeri]
MDTTIRATQCEAYVVNKSNVHRLVALTKERSHRMPSGLTREQRREWAAAIRQKAL